MSAAAEADTGIEDGRTTRAARKRERRRREVLDAALRVFSVKGYHQTRVSDIIAEASIARGTFYLYFDSKNAIFHELLDLLLERIWDNVVGVDTSPDAPPLAAQILVSVRRVLGAFREDRALARLILREAVGIDEETDKKLDDFYQHLHAWLQRSLENGQELGFVRPIDTVNVAWCILGSVKQLLWNVIDEPDAELDRVGRVLLELHLSGLLAK